MPGSPWLCPSLRNGDPLRKTVKILVHIGHAEILFHAIADAFAEFFIHLPFDDEHNVAEARAPCVKQGKIDDDMSFGIDGFDLFQSAETASHSCRHNNKRRILTAHFSFPPFSLCAFHIK